MMPTTSSQTVGPYLHIGLSWDDGAFATAASDPAGFWIRGSVFDGNGEVVPDALIETWQADPDGRFNHPDDPRGAVEYAGFRGFGRSDTVSGEYAIFTRKPGQVPDLFDDTFQAPHLDVSIFARGVLKRIISRIYFEDESSNATDKVLLSIPAERRSTVIAKKSVDGYRLDFYLQGEQESVFFQ
jgi:protocatechuate 3,4-dioxygenase alpha subunit